MITLEEVLAIHDELIDQFGGAKAFAMCRFLNQRFIGRIKRSMVLNFIQKRSIKPPLFVRRVAKLTMEEIRLWIKNKLVSIS